MAVAEPQHGGQQENQEEPWSCDLDHPLVGPVAINQPEARIKESDDQKLESDYTRATLFMDFPRLFEGKAHESQREEEEYFCFVGSQPADDVKDSSDIAEGFFEARKSFVLP